MRHFLFSTASELDVKPKQLLPETLERLEQLQWPGNVRQLENMARWLTVMASSDEIHIEDLPPEIRGANPVEPSGNDWREQLQTWTRRKLQQGQRSILHAAQPAFESIMIKTALAHTGGRRQEAAKLLGWGRNTLTRKIKELKLDKD